MAQHAPLVAVDRTPLGTICIDRQPRSQPQWRSGPLPGCGVRSGRLGSGAASQALQAGLPPVLEADSIDWAAATMVAGTNSGLAQAHISGGATKSGVTRDDLSQPVHPGQRRAEKRAARAPESETHDPPLQARQPETERARTDQGCRIHQRTTGIC